MAGIGKWWLALIGVLPVLGCGAYFLGLHLWANHHFRAAQASIERRDFATASTHLDQCLHARPGNAEARLLAAQTARRNGNTRKAAEHLRAGAAAGVSTAKLDLENQLLIVQEGSDLAGASRLLAETLRQPEGADAPLVLEACIEGNLRALMPIYIQGGTAPGCPAVAQVEQTLEAINVWLRLRQAPADQVQGLVWRAQAHTYAHAQVQALADARQALQLDPEHFDARLHLAMILTQEQVAEAAIQLQILQQRQRDNERVQVALASVRRRLGQLQEAGELLDQYLAEHPDNVSALLERGRIALDQQRPVQGLPWLRRAQQLAPRVPEVNLVLSRCLHEAGMLEEAKLFQDRFQQYEADLARARAQKK